MSDPIHAEAPVALRPDGPSPGRAARALIGYLETALESVESLTRRHTELDERREQLARECQDLREAVEGLRRERDETREVLAELEVAYGALLARYESGQAEVRLLADERTALRDEVDNTLAGLESLARLLRR